MDVPGRRLAFLKRNKLTVLAIGYVAFVAFCYFFDDAFMNTVDAIQILGMRLVRGGEAPPPRKHLIWLMSYPYSGEDQVMNLVEHATGESQATNYGDRMQRRDKTSHKATHPSESIQPLWYPTGPWKNNVDLPATAENVLVKTYCTGTCLFHEQCNRINYIRNAMNVGRFWQSCAKPRSYDPQRDQALKGDKLYWKNRVKKVVILVRSPMAVVADRFKRYATERGLPYNAQALHDWCAMVDEHRGTTKELLHYGRRGHVNKKIEMTEIPCYTEFFRIWVFYERALELTLGRHERLLIRYETFRTRLATTSEDLLKFVGLKKANDMPFQFDRMVRDDEFFTEDEVFKIGIFMRALGRNKSPSSALFEKYF